MSLYKSVLCFALWYNEKLSETRRGNALRDLICLNLNTISKNLNSIHLYTFFSYVISHNYIVRIDT